LIRLLRESHPFEDNLLPMVPFENNFKETISTAKEINSIAIIIVVVVVVVVVVVAAIPFSLPLEELLSGRFLN